MEEWKVIKQAPQYLVSNEGRVKSLKRKRELILSNRKSADGYNRVSLSINGKPKDFRVCRLVAEAFIPNVENKPTVNHIDGDKNNDCIANLEWATMQEQVYHAYSKRLKRPMHNRYLLTDDEIREIHYSYKAHDKQYGMKALAKKYAVSCETIKKWAKCSDEEMEKRLKMCNDYRKGSLEKN